MRAVANRGLDIVAITDHNTVAGTSAIRREIEWLTQLEMAGRLTSEEQARLAEWRQLSNQVLLLPGFEFTATFGFHILAIFPPETPVRYLEHVLLSLNVPAAKLDEGSTETGSAIDVLSAYRIIREAGGIVIAAHANSTHGVAMRNFPFGGQTKIAYTQDPNLDALEVTDFDRGSRSTARFFDGSKREYPRRMHSLFGSDAHRISSDPKNPKRLGIGDRASELLLDEPSFEAIVNLLRSKQFDRIRPARPKDEPFDAVAAARAEGATLTQSFHDSASQRSGRLTAILNDICAFANAMGGAIYIGASPRKTKPSGLENPDEVEAEIRTAVVERIKPPLDVKLEVQLSQEAKVLRVSVPKGPEQPYCLDDYKYYIRDEAESILAVRDELVALVRTALAEQESRGSSKNDTRSNQRGPQRGGKQGRNGERQSSSPRSDKPQSGSTPAASSGTGSDGDSSYNNGDGALPTTDMTAAHDGDDTFYYPQVGVEIVEAEKRHGANYYSIRDLRNGHTIKNVTRKGARRLWNYAIQRYEDAPPSIDQIRWEGNIGLVGSERRAGKVRYDLALRENDSLRVFYGVTDEGMEGAWSVFIQEEE
jgi:hypothetical protein